MVLYFGRTSSFMLRAVIPPFIPFFVVEFHWTPAQLGLLASSYLWSYAIAQLLWGPIIDRWGARKALVASWIVVSAASVGFALGSGLWGLIAFRAVFGFGAAAVIIASVVLITAVYSQQERATALGIMNTAGSVGRIISGVLIPALLTAGLGLAGLEPWRTTALLVTVPAVIATFTVFALPDYKRRGSTRDASKPKNGIGTVLKDVRLYLAAISLTGFVLGVNAVTTWIYLYIYQDYHLSLVAAGTAASFAIFLPAVPGGIVMGWLSDRVNKRARISMLGTIPLTLSVLSLVLRLPLPILLVSLAVYGFFTLSHTPVFSLPTELWSLETSGTALGIISGIAQLCGAASPILTGLVLSSSFGYNGVWLFGGVSYALAGTSLFVLSGRERPRIQATSVSSPQSGEGAARPSPPGLDGPRP